jgi:hypothetical protein
MSLLETFKNYFPAPQNLKPLNNKTDGQINGFQWDIISAPAYILKYLFKSFLDVEQGNELDELQAWYIKHRILRCITSHSIVPAWVYRKMFPLDNDWFYLTDIKNTGRCEWSEEDNYILFEDENQRVLEYDNGVYKLMYKDRILKEFGTKKEEKVKLNTTCKIKYVKKSKVKPILIINGITQRPPLTVKRMSNNFLVEHSKTINCKSFNSFDPLEYKLVKNEMIKRGLAGNKIKYPKYETTVASNIITKEEHTQLIKTHNIDYGMKFESMNEIEYGF